MSPRATAFFDQHKNDLRITLGRNISARSISLDLTEHRLRGRHAVPPTMVLLEVEFNGAIPRRLCTVLNSSTRSAARRRNARTADYAAAGECGGGAASVAGSGTSNSCWRSA